MKFLEKLRTSERSVYIRGFSSDITSEALQSFLEDKVGCVSSLWLSDNVRVWGSHTWLGRREESYTGRGLIQEGGVLNWEGVSYRAGEKSHAEGSFTGRGSKSMYFVCVCS